jgi:hypothetical protein
MRGMGAGKVELYAVDPGILKGLRGTHPIPFCSILGAHDTCEKGTVWKFSLDSSHGLRPPVQRVRAAYFHIGKSYDVFPEHVATEPRRYLSMAFRCHGYGLQNRTAPALTECPNDLLGVITHGA